MGLVGLVAMVGLVDHMGFAAMVDLVDFVGLMACRQGRIS